MKQDDSCASGSLNPPQPLAQTLQMLTPAMRDVVERLMASGFPPLYTLDAAAAKAADAMLADALNVHKIELALVEDFAFTASDGYLIPARLYADSHDRNLPALLYCHGGGFTVGSILSHDGVCREIARQSGVAVVSFDYRLAPEWRFPKAVNDTWDALETLAREGLRYGINPARLAVGGDSAGGMLAAASAIHARNVGIELALQVLIYPCTVAYQDTDAHRRFAEGPLLDKKLLDWFFAQYIDHKDRADWRFAPMRAEDVAGVAPAWIGLAECDPLVDDGVQYTYKLRAAGVPVELEIYRGVIHDFIRLSLDISEAQQLYAAVAVALRKALLF